MIDPAGPAQERPQISLFARLADRHWPAVMGVLNVTPDSFSDGGRYCSVDAALAHARRMIVQGAEIIDIGAESTRPYAGATPVTAQEELRRLAPVLPDVVALGVPVSIDTMKTEVAAFALDRGAAIVNHVWGLQRDAGMAHLVAERGVPVIVMHNRAEVDASIDIMSDISHFFECSLDIAARAGIASDMIALDPGIGFGKTPEQSMIALARLGELAKFGHLLLVGASRKRFIASVAPSEPDERIGGSIAAHLLAAHNGAAIIRAHDVAETVQALRITAAIQRMQGREQP